MAGPTDYLKKRGHTWFVQVPIPARLQEAAGGKRQFVKTLGTRDLNEANKRKWAVIAAYKQRIAALENGGVREPAALADVHEKALAWRTQLARDQGKVLFYEPGHEHRDPVYLNDEWHSQISDEASEIEEEHGEEVATAFFKTARGEGVLLKPQIEPWLSEQTIIEQTKDQHRAVLREFIAWTGRGHLWVEDVDRRYSGEYVGHLLRPDRGLKTTTVRRFISSLSSLWSWLEARALAKDNPWLRQRIGKRAKRSETSPPTQWADEALVKVLSGTYTTRYHDILHDLVKLALVTGARLEELCALTVADVRKENDGWWIDIKQGKTAAAVRTVPVHESAAHVLERRTGARGAHQYLFSTLVPGGPDKRRSWYASKAFGNYTRTLVLKDGERQNFHALRKSFVEVMEGADLPLSTIQLLIGHKRQSLAFSTYSTGKRVGLREAINKLRYSDDVMRLIRAR